jgi:CheY-like chemotaxis protein
MSHKLLLADDSITIQKVVGIIFSGEEYDLTVVDNGTAALERAREIVPDVMLVDALMPGKNGYEVCCEVRRDPVLATVPILLLTGVFEPFDEVKATDSGADDFIAKPFESQALISKIADLLVLGSDRKSAAAAMVAPVPEQLPPVAVAAGVVTDTAAMAPSVGLQGTEPPYPPSPPTALVSIPEEVELLEIVEVTSADDLWGMELVDEEQEEEIPFGTVFEEKEGEALEGIEELEPFVIEEEPLPPQVTYDFAVAPERPGEGFMFDTQPEPAAASPVAEMVVPEFPVLPEMAAIEIGAPVSAREEPEGFVFDVEPATLMPPDEIEEPFAFEEPVDAAPLLAEIEEVLPIVDVTEEAATEVVPTSVGLAPTEAPAPSPVAEPGTSASPVSAIAAFTEEQLISALSKVSREVIERIVWEVVPDLAEALIKEEIRKIRESV